MIKNSLFIVVAFVHAVIALLALEGAWIVWSELGRSLFPNLWKTYWLIPIVLILNLSCFFACLVKRSRHGFILLALETIWLLLAAVFLTSDRVLLATLTFAIVLSVQVLPRFRRSDLNPN
jgi:hypothetical protein